MIFIIFIENFSDIEVSIDSMDWLQIESISSVRPVLTWKKIDVYRELSSPT